MGTIEAVDPQHQDQVAAHIYERAHGQCNTGLQQAGCEAYNDGNQPNAPGGVYACVNIVGGDLDSGEDDLPLGEDLGNANDLINEGKSDGVFVEDSEQPIKEKQNGEHNKRLEHVENNEVHANQHKKDDELELSNEETTESP